MLTLPGLIDPHVHLRSMGQDHKEDFYSGTKAALAGGFTTIIDMPNNLTPITTVDRLNNKINEAKDQIVCDVGFYFGSQGDNLSEFKNANKTLGLKLYLNKTTGNFLVNESYLDTIFSTWTLHKPILLHAIDETIDDVISALKRHPRPVHICHISSEYELSKVIEAKEENLPITCGVTPHHLFLTESDEKHLGAFGKMQPPLRKRSDVDFLWKNLSVIDCIESDHAPHTIEEKQNEHTPFGIPGLETTLPLLLTAISDKKLTVEELIRLCHDNPHRLFLKDTQTRADGETTIEVDMNTTDEISAKNFYSKAKWSPFDGWKTKGALKKVKRGQTVLYENGAVLAQPGSGKILLSS